MNEKTKTSENNLNPEKDKNTLSEKNNIDLKKESENEIKKYNNLCKTLEEKKPIKSDWNQFNEISQLDLSIISLGKNWNALVKEQSLDEIYIKGFKKISPKIKLDSDNNEILLSLIKRDKEIEELKLKLSRFPFVLEEGENLLSIILKSKDNTFNTSIICKNTDKFYKIEELLCEKDSKYNDAEIEFYINGNKIKKNKNLTQNKIKNGDIILFDVLED